jgi:glutamate carboxypeptidase
MTGSGTEGSAVRALLDHLDRRRSVFVERLRELVSVDSGTGSVVGVNRTGDLCERWLRDDGWQIARHPMDRSGTPFGDLLVAEHDGGGAGTALLIGHTDTVFPDGTAASRPLRVEGGRIYGPGVCDMKGGLLCGVLAVEALRATRTSFGHVIFLLDPDEEVGSPASRASIAEHARRADAVFVLEAARENGAVVTARKGVTNARVRFHGRAAHAGVEPEKGRSAVLAAAHLTIAVHDLNGRWDGTTFNVGLSDGGSRVNVVPESASLSIEIRSTNEAALGAAEEELRRLAGRSAVPDVAADLEMTREHGPMERSDATAALFDRARSLAAELDLALDEAATGGASDANITAALGVPTLDGLGPIGGDDHSPAEWIDLSSFAPRSAILAALIAGVQAGASR